MDKFNEGKYSLEEAQNEAEKMRQKVGKETASSYAYEEAEKKIEIEKRVVLQAPISEEMKDRNEEAYKKTREVDEEIERRLREIRMKLRDELGKEVNENYHRVTREVGKEAQEALGKWLQEIYEGKHGRGDLVVVTSISRDTRPTLARVIPIENPADSGMHQYTAKNVAGLVSNRQVKDYEIYRPSQSDTLEKLETYFDTEQFLRHINFVEVDFAGTTEDQIDDLCIKLKENGWLMSSILEAFPKDYKPKVQVGEILDFGGCSHHSGEIYGKQIVLPTGRLAVVSKYEGENEDYETYQFWGVLTDPNIEPDWSAKRGGWEGPQLNKPTPEETAFLKGMDVEFPDEKSLGDMKKMLESGEEAE